MKRWTNNSESLLILRQSSLIRHSCVHKPMNHTSEYAPSSLNIRPIHVRISTSYIYRLVIMTLSDKFHCLGLSGLSGHLGCIDDQKRRLMNDFEVTWPNPACSRAIHLEDRCHGDATCEHCQTIFCRICLEVKNPRIRCRACRQRRRVEHAAHNVARNAE